MLFDEGLDRSLSLILNIDVDHRNLISLFINSMPNMFIKSMKENIDYRDECKSYEIIFNESTYEEYKTLNGFMYWYELFPSGNLNIGCKIRKNKEYKDVFILRIVSMDKVDNVEDYYQVNIGSIEYNTSKRVLTNSEELKVISFDFIKNTEGYGILWQEVNGSKARYYEHDILTPIDENLVFSRKKISGKKLVKEINKNNKLGC